MPEQNPDPSMEVNVMLRCRFYREAGPFLEWLVAALLPGGFNHHWTSRSGKTGVPRGETWSCDSLFSAFEGYGWAARLPDEPRMPHSGTAIHSFAETDETFSWLRAELLSAIHEGNSDRCLRLSNVVLDWGGVGHRPAIAKVLRSRGDSLAEYLGTITRHFARHDLCCVNPQSFVVVKGEYVPIGLDSGTTKIFSCICRNFTISDGRVGAALGALVARWNKETQGGSHEAIPACLRFGYWPRIKMRDPKPVDHPRFVYPVLAAANEARIGQNLRVNWICRYLATAAKDTGFSMFDRPAKRSRPIEAALFMIGYAVK